MNILYTYRYRLMPNVSQQILLAKHFGAKRYVYNYFLTRRKNEHLNNNKSQSYYDNCKELTELKKSLLWLKEVNAQSLQYSLKCLDIAYNNFFCGKNNFPKYKSKHCEQSFRIPQEIEILNNKLYIPKFKKGIKLVKHREIEGIIKFATIKKNKSGQYHVSITVEREISELPKSNKEVGIDLGIKTLAVCSDGTIYKNIKPYRKLKKRLKILQRRVDKSKKGSKNRDRARKKLAKLHQRITNTRINHLHKVTRKIINENQVIVLESLAVQNMMKNHCLAGAIADASWSELNRQLEYKAVWYGRIIGRLSRWFPSSKTCSCCGWINKDLKLKDREWICLKCGKYHDRDLNAAIMILQQWKIENKLPLERREAKRLDSEESDLDSKLAEEERRSNYRR